MSLIDVTSTTYWTGNTTDYSDLVWTGSVWTYSSKPFFTSNGMLIPTSALVAAAGASDITGMQMVLSANPAGPVCSDTIIEIGSSDSDLGGRFMEGTYSGANPVNDEPVTVTSNGRWTPWATAGDLTSGLMARWTDGGNCFTASVTIYKIYLVTGAVSAFWTEFAGTEELHS